MALFRSDKRSLLQRIRKMEWRTPEQRREMLSDLTGFELRLGDVVWMLLVSDRAVRDTAARIIIDNGYSGAFAEVFSQACEAPESPHGAAVRVMAELGTAAELAQLVALAHGDNPEERIARQLSVEVLLHLPLNRGLEYVQRLLRHDNREVRYRAIRRVAEAPAGRVEGKLRKHIFAVARDPEERIRLEALKLLAQFPGPDTIELFVERLRTDGFAVRSVVEKALESMSYTGELSVSERLIPLLSETDDRVREVAFGLALRHGQATEVIRRVILYSKTLMGWMRERVFLTVAGHGKEVLEPLIELMAHEDEDIRNAALIFATRFRDESLLEPIARLVNDDNWWTRVIAIETLGQYKDERLVDVLMGALDDEEVRWSAIEALANIGSRRALVPIAKLLRDGVPDVRREVIRALEVYDDPRALPVLEQCFKNDPDLAVRERALEAYRAIAKGAKIDVDAGALREAALQDGPRGTFLEKLLNEARRMGASDLHIGVGASPYVRSAGHLKRLDIKSMEAGFSDEQIRRIVREVLDEDQQRMLRREHQVDVCIDVPGVGRYRMNAFSERRGLRAVFRIIPSELPEFEQTGLPQFLTEIPTYNQGLVIVSGPSGAGKSTTLAALVNLINARKRVHIVTLEEPIEHVHPYHNSLVSQREIGRDSESYGVALRAAMREDADVLVVGELRNADTIRMSLDAAQTGHLVLATVNTTSATKTVSHLIEAFPASEHSQIRSMLAESLRLIICQLLLPGREGGLVACHELLIMTSAVTRAVRDEKDALLPSLIQMGRNIGMRAMDESLLELVKARRISGRTAYRWAEKKETFEDHVDASVTENIL